MEVNHANGPDREVVILMTDMVRYSQISSGMTPDEIRDFLIDYHERIHDLILREESKPLEIEPSAGDGCLVIFDKRPGEERSAVCTRAVDAALRMARAVAARHLPPTRMGILLGRITEAMLGNRMAKFGASFAVANRLEELCGYFGTDLLMGREISRHQQSCQEYLVNIVKVSLTSVLHPMNIFSIYMPGTQSIPANVDRQGLREFVRLKNDAMDHFSGNQLANVEPDFPMVRRQLLEAQKLFRELTGKEDKPIERVLEYIRETPTPGVDFVRCGMQLMEKKRDSLGERLYHLSKQLLRAMNPRFYHVLVEDTDWERYFRLEWGKAGEIILEIDSVADGIYYLDSGVVEALNAKGELLATMEAGTIFGEMAYFGGEQRRTATVRAKTDVVLRRITTRDFQKLPVIVEIFERIARARRREILANPNRPQDKAIPSPEGEGK